MKHENNELLKEETLQNIHSPLGDSSPLCSMYTNKE